MCDRLNIHRRYLQRSILPRRLGPTVNITTNPSRTTTRFPIVMPRRPRPSSRAPPKTAPSQTQPQTSRPSAKVPRAHVAQQAQQTLRKRQAQTTSSELASSSSEDHSDDAESEPQFEAESSGDESVEADEVDDDVDRPRVAQWVDDEEVLGEQSAEEESDDSGDDRGAGGPSRLVRCSYPSPWSRLLNLSSVI